MLLEANMLILDEPTNHLDLFSREVLESALIDFDGTLLFISHDRYFLNKMAERIVELSSNGTEQFLGNYDDYTEKKQELEELQQEAMELVARTTSRTDSGLDHTDKPGVTTFEADKLAKREERNRQRRLVTLEEEIHILEEDIKALEAKMALPEIFQDYMALQEHQQKVQIKKQSLEEIYNEWELLAVD